MLFLILAVLSILMIWIATKSGLLRNEIFSSDNLCKIAKETGIKNPKPAFSLGRTQLAFWTAIIVSSFIYVVYHAIQNGTDSAITIPEISGVNLVLLGMASGTTIIAKVIDGNQMNSQGAIIPQQDHPSKNFFIDIISDEKGVSIHRLQNVVWTVVVGALYLWHVNHNNKLPDDKTISDPLLALMGISTGAYLGLKTVENQAEPATPAFENTNSTKEAGANSTPPLQNEFLTTKLNGTTPDLAMDDVSNSSQHDY